MCYCSGLIKAIDAYIEKADKDLKKRLKKEGFAEVDTTIEAASELEESIANTLKEQTAMFTADLNGNIDLETFYSDVWPTVKGTDKTDINLAKTFLDEFQKTMPQLISAYIKESDSDLTLETVSKRTTDWIKEWSEELGGIMKLNSSEEFEKILIEGLDEGYSIDTVARKIMNSGIRDEYSKARRAALTEILRAHSVARHEGIIQSPVVEKKMWRHSGEYKIEPRQNHIEMDGQTVDKDQPFNLIGADGGSYAPMYPRDVSLPPEESINCHCIVVGIVSEEILGKTLEERKRMQRKAIEEDDGEWEKELDARNKAKAGINEDTIKIDWLKAKSQQGQINYLGTKSRWALVESGVIKTDEDLAKLYKTVKTTGGENVIVRKTLNELKKDGIITINKSTVSHSARGEYTGASKAYPSGRLKGGGHSAQSKAELKSKGIEYNVTKTYSNGVTLGNIPSHKETFKRSGDFQAWFPDSWDDDKILTAGTYVSNSGNPIIDNRQTGIFDNVAVRVMYNPKTGDIDTICPDYDQTIVKGVKEK